MVNKHKNCNVYVNEYSSKKYTDINCELDRYRNIKGTWKLFSTPQYLSGAGKPCTVSTLVNMDILGQMGTGKSFWFKTEQFKNSH